MGINQRTGHAKAAAGAMLVLGVAALVASIAYGSVILAFIGLGLTFWGTILFYIQNQDYVPKTLLDASVLPSIETMNQMIQELDFKGNAMYLPPKYFEDPEAAKIYIPKQKDAALPTPEQIEKYEHQLIVKNPQGLLLTPPGAELAKLFEKTLETSFNKVDLEYLQKNMPKLFIEDLEIAENLEIQTKPSKAAKELTDSVSLIHSKNDTIHVKIANSIYKDICKEARQLSYICGAIGCPLCSAIACALTKATGKPITIEKIQPTEDGKIIEADYRVLETTEPQEQVGKAIAETSEVVGRHSSRLSKVASLFLIAFGSTILAWAGWLTWHDIATWSKDIASIFFGSRTGEAISLGIGMKLIYYLMIGLTSLVIGLFTFLRRRRRTT